MNAQRRFALLLITGLLAAGCGSATAADTSEEAISTDAMVESEEVETEESEPAEIESAGSEPAQVEPTDSTPAEDSEPADSESADSESAEVCENPADDAIPAADLRIMMHDLIQDHITRTHDLVTTAGEFGLEAPETAAAYDDLDQNGLEIGQAVALVYDEGAGDAFVALWRRHLGFFVDYAAGVATEDQAAQDDADAALRAYSQDFAAFFAAATEDRMPSEPTVETFDGHIDTVEALIRDSLTGAESEAMSSHEAHDHVLELSNMITDAVVSQFPCRFPAE